MHASGGLGTSALSGVRIADQHRSLVAWLVHGAGMPVDVGDLAAAAMQQLRAVRENDATLAANAAARGHERRADPAREGPALLQGPGRVQQVTQADDHRDRAPGPSAHALVQGGRVVRSDLPGTNTVFFARQLLRSWWPAQASSSLRLPRPIPSGHKSRSLRSGSPDFRSL